MGLQAAQACHVRARDLTCTPYSLRYHKGPKPWKFSGFFITSLYRELGNPEKFQGFGSLSSSALSANILMIPVPVAVASKGQP